MTQFLPQQMNERLRDARKASGFESAAEAAKRFGWAPSTYAGHENGHRGFKMKTARKYAAAFNVTPEWIMFGTVRKLLPAPPEPVYRQLAEAMSEYIPPTDTIAQDMNRLGRHLQPGARAITYLEVPRAYPGLSLMKGDVLVVDQLTTDPAEGTVVVCQVVDTDTGEGSTVLKISARGGPVPAYGEPRLGNSEQESVIGSVIYSLRGAPGT